ncbi:MAG: hypothetical protein HYZ49_16040 [Chloroflexi bacterium]|nr:hypothetical protein [Chloroflexota bacterium]
MQPQLPFYRRQWFRIGAPVTFVLVVYALMHFRQPDETLAGWMVDILGFAMLFLGTLALASQYILPVSTAKERQGAVDRLFTYVLGGHGPIVFVRDGELVGSAEELKRKGAGVMLIDAASAVVLEKGRKFSRAVGPGIAFVAFGERIATTLDLRKQSRSQSAQALTRDGIEIKADVSVAFALDPGNQASLRDTRDENDFLGQTPVKPPYPFNADSAFKAFYGEAIAEKEAIKWIDLPAIVAVEHFRDQVSRLTLDKLFEIHDPGATPLATLQSNLRNEVQSAPLLRARGIKVYSASAGNIELPEAVIRQRIRAWAVTWQKEIFKKLADADVKIEKIKEQARAEAQHEILDEFRDVFNDFKEGFKQSVSAQEGALVSQRDFTQRLVSALNKVAGDPVTQMLAPGNTVRQLSNLRQWVGLQELALKPQMIGQQEAAEETTEIVAEEAEPTEAAEPSEPALQAVDANTDEVEGGPRE